MANPVPTGGQSIIVETQEALDADRSKYAIDPCSALTGWITSRVNIWEDARDRAFRRLWGEYWRMWRGAWSQEDMNRLSERSKLVAPALSQAIEMTVSELEEAIFSNDSWFDVAETAKQMADAAGKQIVQAVAIKNQLISDLDLVKARDQIMEAVLNGALFGTLVAKINVYVGKAPKPTRDDTTFELKTTGDDRVFVSIEAIRPDQFIPDPVGQTIEDMLGCAQRIRRTMHYVQERIEQGIYRKEALRSLSSISGYKNTDIDWQDPQSINTTYESEQVTIVEYHGKVPAYMLAACSEAKTDLDHFLGDSSKLLTAGNGTGPMVEAIVTIANGSTLLRAMVNPFVMQDRAIIACQFEKVPGRFWGRGVAEKGYNPQKALDSELRARIDALGFINAPMMGIDSSRLPKGFRMEVKPGKVWTTQGNPSEVLQPVKIGDYSTLTFEQTQEMERMVQMGTGAFDTASALKNQSASGGNSSSANSMLMGAFVKRAKRSISNIDRNFLTPLLNKVKWRYMQFDPLRYPTDVELDIQTTMGIVAREVEASQMTQLIGMMPSEFHSVQLQLVQGIIENSSLRNKGALLKTIATIVNPTPQAQQAAQQAAQQQQQLQTELQHATLQKLMVETQKTVAETKKILGQTEEIGHDASANVARIHQGWEQLQLKKQEQAQFAEQNHIAAARLPIEAAKAHAALMSAQANAAKARPGK